MNELNGKIALVVGAGCIGDGIGNGRATAITFAREGAHVICADIDSASASETVEMIRNEGHTASSSTFDVTDSAAVADTIASILTEHGRIDVLDNNVGIAALGGVTDITPSEWERVFKINLDGVFNTMRHVIPSMVANGGGSIVNISSVAGVDGNPGQSNDAAAKAGVIGLTKTLAKEWGRYRVNVNAVAFGFILPRMTEAVAGDESFAEIDGRKIKVGVSQAVMDRVKTSNPFGRPGTPEEAAGAVYVLCTPDTDYVSGQCLNVDAGSR